MGCIHRNKWDDKKISDSIFFVMNELNISRMPSCSEMRSVGQNALACKIGKTQEGFYGWAEKLGLEIKPSETYFGWLCEKKVCSILQSIGHTCVMTSARCEYDLLVDGDIRVDVKAAHVSKVRDDFAWSFRLAKPKPTCDIYVAVCVDGDGNIIKSYIIPAKDVEGNVQIAIGFETSMYDKYIDRWDLFRQEKRRLL